MTPTGITRDMVLAAASGLRASDPSTSSETATGRALRDIVGRALSAASSDSTDWTAWPAAVAGAVDGVLIDVTTYDSRTGATSTRTIVALTTTDASSTLDGTATISTTARPDGTPIDGSALATATLSGDVFVSAPLDTSTSGALAVSATGNVTRTVAGAPPSRVGVSADEAAAAKKAYDKALKAAKKSYAKAKRKAGTNTAKKARAKRAYAKKKAALQATYRRAPAGSRMVEQDATENSPFALAISTDTGWALAG